MPLRNLVWLLIVPGLVALGLAIGYSAPAPDKDYQLVRQIVDVLAEVDANYVRELTDDEREKLVEDMINGGLHKLDPHSQYLNEKDLEAVRDARARGASAGSASCSAASTTKTKLLQRRSSRCPARPPTTRGRGRRPDREGRRRDRPRA